MEEVGAQGQAGAEKAVFSLAGLGKNSNLGRIHSWTGSDLETGLDLGLNCVPLRNNLLWAGLGLGSNWVRFRNKAVFTVALGLHKESRPDPGPDLVGVQSQTHSNLETGAGGCLELGKN